MNRQCNKCNEDYIIDKWGDDRLCPKCWKKEEIEMEAWLDSRGNDMEAEELD